jgi:hypothetical protein
MRIAVLVIVLAGCAKSADKAAKQESTTGAVPVQAAEPPKTDSSDALKQGGGSGGPPPPPAPGGPGRTRGGGGSANVDVARGTGVLGPADQRAFNVTGKVTVKTSTLKALDQSARGKLEALQACYDKALEFQDSLAGELTLDLRAGKLAIAKSTLKHPELEKCVLEVFPADALPQGKGTVTLAFKRE